MIEYKKTNSSDTGKLSTLRVDMLCEDKECDDNFKEKMFTSTQEYINKGLHDIV